MNTVVRFSKSMMVNNGALDSHKQSLASVYDAVGHTPTADMEADADKKRRGRQQQ